MISKTSTIIHVLWNQNRNQFYEVVLNSTMISKTTHEHLFLSFSMRKTKNSSSLFYETKKSITPTLPPN